MIRRCVAAGGKAGMRMMQEFAASRRAGARLRIAHGHEKQNADRARHGELATRECRRVVEAYNRNFQRADWGVLTTLVSMYLALADGASRYLQRSGSIDTQEAMTAYWPGRAPRSDVATLCYSQAYKAAVAIGLGVYQDMLDRYPSRNGYPEVEQTDSGGIRAAKRRVAIGIDDHERPVELSLREKQEIQAASFIKFRSVGAWLGFMAMDPPEDWDAPRGLPIPGWSTEWGHPDCVLPEKSDGVEGFFRNSAYLRMTLFLPNETARGLEATKAIWKRRRRHGLNLSEPSFTFDEAIEVFGAVVGTCPQSEATAHQFFRFCHSRELAGRLSPRWTLRLCRDSSCPAPLFIHEVTPAKGNAALPNYCARHNLSSEVERQRRKRQRDKLA